MTTCQKKSRLKCKNTNLRLHDGRKCALITDEEIFSAILHAREVNGTTYCKIETSLDGVKHFLSTDIADLREIGRKEKVLIILLKGNQ